MGQYLEITDLVVTPASPSPGDIVAVAVKVKNVYVSDVTAKVQGAYVYTTGGSAYEFAFSPVFWTISSGQTYTFLGSFYMPGDPIIVSVYSLFHYSGVFYLDDGKVITITPASTPAISEFKIASFSKA